MPMQKSERKPFLVSHETEQQPESYSLTRRELIGLAKLPLYLLGARVADEVLFCGAVLKRIREELSRRSQASAAEPQVTAQDEVSQTYLSIAQKEVTAEMQESSVLVSDEEETESVRENRQIETHLFTEETIRHDSEVILPVENGIRRAYFGKPIPYTTRWPDGSRYVHNALDIQGQKNDPIYTPADGVVMHVGPIYKGELSQGKQVVIVCYPEYNVCASYGHNSKATVEAGQNVKKGDQIALLGDKGFCSPGYYHVHWEVWKDTQFSGDWRNPWKDGYPIDPEEFLKAISDQETQ